MGDLSYKLFWWETEYVSKGWLYWAVLREREPKPYAFSSCLACQATPQEENDCSNWASEYSHHNLFEWSHSEVNNLSNFFFFINKVKNLYEYKNGTYFFKTLQKLILVLAMSFWRGKKETELMIFILHPTFTREIKCVGKEEAK